MVGKVIRLNPNRIAVFWLAVATAVATFVLIWSGGLVTSKGVGMAVPDWPTTYGYNMFLFPVSRWVGGIFYEHTHRLLASGVGFLTLVLTVWICIADNRTWVKVLACCALAGVVVQGLLGGLRVTMFKDEIGIFHGMLAQTFFFVITLIAVVTSRPFIAGTFANFDAPRMFRWFALVLTLAIFTQLGVGATMRHAHLGLSIPDFPTAYGQWWPDTSPAAMEAINTARVEANEMPTTPLQIHLQMFHRIFAFVITAGMAVFAWLAWRRMPDRFTRIAAAAWVAMILAQMGLGMWTVWSGKAADVATAHVALGALCLLLGGMLCFRLFYAAGEFQRNRTGGAPAAHVKEGCVS